MAVEDVAKYHNRGARSCANPALLCDRKIPVHLGATHPLNRPNVHMPQFTAMMALAMKLRGVALLPAGKLEGVEKSTAEVKKHSDG